jgi:hypothetical protein
LACVVIESTNVTANPRPMAVSRFLEMARKEHIPKKYASRMFPTKMEFKKMLMRFSIVLFF